MAGTVDKESVLLDFKKAVASLGACVEAVDWLDAEMVKNTELTAEHVLNIPVKDKEAWLAWCIYKLGLKKATAAFREKMIGGIVRPMLSFQMYVKISDLTEAEDKILESNFVGKLPVAEKQLKDGVIKRAKLPIAEGL